MKLNRSIIFSLGLLILAASLYRAWSGRPPGFAPQIAIAIFAGAVIKDKKWSFLVPVLSMFISDLIYQVLYLNGWSKIQGFYEGQWSNYILITALTVFGFMARSLRPARILISALLAPTAYFLASNLLVWAGTGGYGHPKTWDGLMLTYADGLPFYPYSILSTLIFSAIFFGCYFVMARREQQKAFA